MKPAHQHAAIRRPCQVVAAILAAVHIIPFVAFSLGHLPAPSELRAADEPVEGETRQPEAGPPSTAGILSLLRDDSPGIDVGERGERDVDRSHLTFPSATSPTRHGRQADGRHRFPEEDLLPEDLRAHCVTLTSSGSLTGRVTTLSTGSRQIPAPGLNIAFIQSGQVLARVTSGREGEFELEDFAPGVYSIVAFGPNGLAAYSLIVLSHADRTSQWSGESRFADTRWQGVDEHLQLEVTALHPTFWTVRNLLERYYPRMEVSTFGQDVYEQLMEETARQVPEHWGAADLAEAHSSAPRASTVRTHPVRLQMDGSLRGRVMGMNSQSGRPRPIRRMNVFILRNDRVMARSSVDERGVFRIRGLHPGDYGVVAAGPDGFGAMAFELVAAEDTTVADGHGLETHWVRWQDDSSQGILSLNIIGDPTDSAADDDDPAASGAAMGGGGGAGGGGGDGGAGAIDGLNATSAAGLIGAAAATSDSGSRSAASPTVPMFVP